MTTITTVDIVESNNADWSSSLVLPSPGPAPWVTVPAFDPTVIYPLGATVTQNGDLLMALSPEGPGTFDPTQWVLVGKASNYALDPYDPTGAAFRMFVSRVGTDGNADPSQIVVQLRSDGDKPTLSLSGRTLTLGLLAVAARALTAGTYRHDVLGIKTNGVNVQTRRVFKGSFTIEQGITR